MNFKMFVRCFAHKIGSIDVRDASIFLGSLNSISKADMFSSSSCENNFHGLVEKLLVGRPPEKLIRAWAPSRKGENTSQKGYSPSHGLVQVLSKVAPSISGNNCNRNVDTCWY